MGKFKHTIYIACIFAAVLLLFITLWLQEHYLFISLIMIVVAMLPFYIKFERRELKPEEIVLIAMLAAIAAVSRIPFAPIPSVQPTSFVIIMSALVFGPEVGFLVGSIAAVVSNIFLGQGPWTPWQMFGWGMMGLTAGLLRNTVFMKSLIGKNIFGFVWGFVFGWFMNLWVVLGFLEEINWNVIFMTYVSSFYFDLAHALSNVIFITVFSSVWLRILLRIKGKYGMLSDGGIKGK